MEFMSRGRPTPPAQTPPAAASAQKKKHVDWVTRTVRFELFVVIVGAALLLLAITLWLVTGNYKNLEASQVKENQYQAVFLTNNQVYFGKITDIGKGSLVLTDVFYIETPNQAQNATSASNTNYTLRKLGANELHSPEDKMVINREQVTFWENLKDNGQVVTKIKEYKQNPEQAEQQAAPPAEQPVEQPAEQPSSGN